MENNSIHNHILHHGNITSVSSQKKPSQMRHITKILEWFSTIVTMETGKQITKKHSIYNYNILPLKMTTCHCIKMDPLKSPHTFIQYIAVKCYNNSYTSLKHIHIQAEVLIEIGSVIKKDLLMRTFCTRQHIRITNSFFLTTKIT